MILHILGPSGSGKTTLGNKLSKLNNVIVIDTDDIDDPNSMKIIDKYKFDKKSDGNKFDKELAKLNRNDLEKIINKNINKNIIIVGFLHLGMDFIKINKGFSIKIEPEILWRQYNLRTTRYIKNNIKEIEKLLNSNINPEKIHIIFSKKFGIRNGFDCAGIDDIKHSIERNKKIAKENKYYYNTSDNIYKKINDLIKE